MAKKVIGFIKLHVPGGQANPAPPVGPALGQHGVNIMEFCKQFNAKTQDKQGITIPVEITVYADRSFTFITKTPPASVLILRAIGIPKVNLIKTTFGDEAIGDLFGPPAPFDLGQRLLDQLGTIGAKLLATKFAYV